MSGARLACREDIPALVALMAEFYAEAGFSLPTIPAAQSFARLIDDPRLGEAWLVEEHAGAVGYLVLTFGFSMEFGGPRAFIDDFFVRPTTRGRGLGAAMLQTVRQECSNRGVRALLVETGLEGHRARRLYARAGFETSGRVLLTQPLAPPVHEL